MKADRLRVREALRQRPEPREGCGRPVLVVEADGGGGQRFGVIRRHARSGCELPLGGDGPQGLLERGALQ